MSYRTYSYIAGAWILLDMIILKNNWFSENIFPHPEFIRVVRIVAPLLLSAGVCHYIVRKMRDEESVEEEWWHVILLPCLLLLVSILVFFRWY